MQRINSPHREPNLFGAGKAGYREGDPVHAILPTEFTALATNALQEEIANALEGNGIALDSSTNAQLLALLRSFPTAAANWFLRSTLGTAFNGVAYDSANGLWVAVGAAGVIARSSDGVTWTATSVGGGITLQAVAHNGVNLWVAVGSGGVIYISADAISWFPQASGTTNDLHAVAHITLGGLWIACGAAGTLLSGNSLGTGWAACAYGGTVNLRAIGYDPATELTIVAGDGTFLLSSPDAVVWTPRVLSVGSPNNYLAIAHRGGTSPLWVVVGTDALVLTSPDGAAWTLQPVTWPATADLLAIAVSPTGTCVAVGAGGQVLSSTDLAGVAWSSRQSTLATDLDAVCYAAGFWVAVGAGGKILNSLRV